VGTVLKVLIINSSHNMMLKYNITSMESFTFEAKLSLLTNDFVDVGNVSLLPCFWAHMKL
jgi:hypothetical protein